MRMQYVTLVLRVILDEHGALRGQLSDPTTEACKLFVGYDALSRLLLARLSAVSTVLDTHTRSPLGMDDMMPAPGICDE